MSRHDHDVRFQHMLDHAREIIGLTEDGTREDLDTNRMLDLALTRLLEVIGEAAARIPAQERARHPKIPWPEIIGLRNRLIHGYDSVDLDILWKIVRKDIPDLVKKLESIVNEKRG